MPIRHAKPDRFTARGLVDAFDGTDLFKGACRQLQNLIFDQSNPEIMLSRPGVGTPITVFNLFTSPTYVSVFIVVGTMCYGMVASSDVPGHDVPFAYDLVGNAFIAVGGATSANTPVTQSTTGPWTPPTMAIVSTKILVTHPGFSGATNVFFGIIDITVPALPAWSSANTSINLLPSVPQAVVNFGNRAYFACKNVSYFTDVLLPTQMTNATNNITHGDITPIVGYAGMPVTTLSGGVLQALLVFKGNQIWQVTGDIALSNLAQNFVSLTSGCVAGRSIVQTPMGTFYVAVDGPYVVDLSGVVRALTHDPQSKDQDLQAPFQNSVTGTTLSTRMAAGYTGDTYRICLNTVILGTAALNDYWFNTHRMRWTGPHTWPADCLGAYGNAFITSHRTLGAALYLAPTLAATNSVYNDNGAAVACLVQPSSYPKHGTMRMSSVVESTIELSSSGTQVTYTMQFMDEQFNLLNQALLTVPTVGGKVWGSNTWGDGSVWTSFASIPHVYTIPWTAPIVYQKGLVQVSATANASLAIGTLYIRVEELDYTNQG